jgi:hypothetical protein
MAKENARDNLLEAISKEEAKSNPNKRVLDRLQRQLTRIGGITAGGGSEKTKAKLAPAKAPDVRRVADRPTSPDVLRVADRPAKNPDVLRVMGRPAKSPDVLRVADRPAKNPDVLITRPTSGATPKAKPSVPRRPTSGATPKAKPSVPRRPTAGNNMIAATPPSGGTLSKKDVDEYSEAFASPDADKMYALSEKNRRKDMNMLERAFDSIKVAGDRATADRKKRGLSDYDMNEEFYFKKGGRVGATMKKTRKSSVRKRAAKRGFGVETRGN